MSAQTDPILFEAICTPARSLGRRGMWLVAGAVLAASLLIGTVFALFGAWPVLGFTGLEAALVLGLMALHRRWSARSAEALLLTEGRLLIRRTDAKGRQEEVALDPYWARLRLEERPGRVSRLVLQQRQREVEVGRLLGEEQKRDLAGALQAALRRYREPAFDNPQLR
ncbi:DUF2244 domain-containing protein [Paracraurococcus ruber]|uniref:DUF2244 domain-containing protein n=1 Tax=Paracraurococcus ruber TaxID=77675 RepID=A0ABS1D0V4_9PROT|nr:DUF2244 domain-containing protein [Paracraurococcus ruber]MBK1659917.1 hypothetical protein [Paracraurococcus ruber]TDG27363.1 DUF2244 domain-containing protein [Paracraurococcus ruber]